jgi:flagellar protein FlbD
VTRFHGSAFALNPDLIERADSTPDTVITLVDGTKYIIAESVPDFIELVRQYRASVIAEAHRQVDAPDLVRKAPRAAERDANGNVVQLHPKER